MSSLSHPRYHINESQNEVYYSLNGNITVPASMVLSHCVVSRDTQVKPGYSCLSSIDARRGLYYEFDWVQLREKALEVPDFWDCREQWDIKSEDIIPATPARSRVASSLESSDEDEAPSTHKKPDHKKVAKTTRTDVHSGPGRKRKRTSSKPAPAKRTRPMEDSDSESSGSGSSDDYVAPQGSSDTDSDNEVIAAIAELDESSDSGEEDVEEDVDNAPRTPRKRHGSRPGTPRTPKTPRTPRNKRGVKLAAPTPHSKAALRARASRKRVLAVRPPPPDRAYDLAFLENVPKDPWLRAMHVLHVASRPDALPCREEEYGRVLRSTEELLDEGSGGCVCTWCSVCFMYSLLTRGPDISGVPGTGKTATVHAVVRELKRMAEQDVSYIIPTNVHSFLTSIAGRQPVHICRDQRTPDTRPICRIRSPLGSSVWT